MMNKNLLARAKALTASSTKALPERTGYALDSAKKIIETPKTGLDVYMCFDTTGSMGRYIREVRRQIDTVVGSLFNEGSSMRVSMNGVGDHCDGANCLQLYELSSNPEEVRGALDNIVMTGGGDEPEAYECLALELAQHIPKASADRRRAVVLVADSVPHGMIDGPCVNGVDYEGAFAALKTLSEGFYFVGCNPQMYGYQRQLIDPSKKDREQFIPLGEMTSLLPELLVALAKKTDSPAALREYMETLTTRAPENAGKIKGLLGMSS
jgi:hypothetical protein